MTGQSIIISGYDRKNRFAEVWEFRNRLLHDVSLVIMLLGFMTVIFTPVTAVTTSINIVKYANDGTTILNRQQRLTSGWNRICLSLVMEQHTITARDRRLTTLTCGIMPSGRILTPGTGER